jgi:small subunit ribosomal protein S20
LGAPDGIDAETQSCYALPLDLGACKESRGLALEWIDFSTLTEVATVPTTDSAEKRIRQNEKRRERNQNRKSRLTTAERRFEEALEADNLDEAEAYLRDVESEYDRAASKGVVPQKRASRKISRLSKRLAARRSDEE